MTESQYAELIKIKKAELLLQMAENYMGIVKHEVISLAVKELTGINLPRLIDMEKYIKKGESHERTTDF